VSSAPAPGSSLLTLVFTDLAGSTALKVERGDVAGGALIARHREHVTELAREHAGRVVDFAGDGAFLAFEAPSAAAQFALALQAAHAAEPELPAVRVGIHLGEVSEREGRVEGLAVDLASRVQSLARPGQVLLSAAAAGAARQRTPGELSGRTVRWRSHGAYTLKGTDEPLEIYEAGLEGVAPFAAPLAGEKARPTRRAIPRIAALLLGALLLAGAGGAWWFLARNAAAPTATPSSEPVLSPIRSLAVLPLANLSGDPEQEYYADGMTETLIAELAKLPGVRVISRTSVMQFKGKRTPLPEIAKLLNVEGVIEGSVMRAENQVRITAQLIDARSDQHVWAEQYDRELARVLEIQSEVAKAVAKQIALALTPEQAARLKPPKPVDPRAQVAYFRGLSERDLAMNWGSAQTSFEESVRLAPEFAPAWAALSIWYSASCYLGCEDVLAAAKRAREAAARALQLDPDLGDAHAAAAMVDTYFGWDWPAAERGFRRAQELGSSTDPFGKGALLATLLLDTGRRDEALAEFERWSREAPPDLTTRGLRFDFLFYTGRYEEALREANFALQADRTAANFHFFRGDALELLGRYEDAIDSYKEGLAASGDASDGEALERGFRSEGRAGYFRAWERRNVRQGEWTSAAGSRAMRGDIDGAFALLERAFEARDPYLRRLIVSPWLAPLRSDPRFADLARRMKLPLPKP
jgi:TolB-like protein/class 3 adenylate cyclase